MKIGNSSTPPLRGIAILCADEGLLEHRTENDPERLRDVDKQILSGLEKTSEAKPPRLRNSERHPSALAANSNSSAMRNKGDSG
jgi:hypothetical protein